MVVMKAIKKPEVLYDDELQYSGDTGAFINVYVSAGTSGLNGQTSKQPTVAIYHLPLSFSASVSSRQAPFTSIIPSGKSITGPGKVEGVPLPSATAVKLSTNSQYG